jgi:Flp pilus assembly protein TadG
MMKKLDERGVAALEFTLVAVPLFILMFVIFDLGRYAITVQSLHALANAEARAVMTCYGNNVTPTNPQGSYTGCTPSGGLVTSTSTPNMQDVAPFLYAGGLAPTVTIAAGASPMTITASQTGFTMLMPIWGTALNGPSVSTSIPF